MKFTDNLLPKGIQLQDNYSEVRPLIDAVIDSIDDAVQFKINCDHLSKTAASIYSPELLTLMSIHVQNLIEGRYNSRIIKKLSEAKK